MVVYRRGVEVFECDGEEFAWPRCEITGCENFVCMGMSQSLCYPHGIEFGAFTKEEFEADRQRRHGPDSDSDNDNRANT